ncbi:MAG: dihydrofolate reductase family protein [Chloroflexota bacterium]
MTNVFCHIAISLDGYAAGPNQSKDNPLGEGGMRLHEWTVKTASWREQHALEGGERNPSSAVIEEVVENVGAYIMGRNMFDHGRGDWDPDWRGWWGDDPPFHTPVFVLTHRERASIQMERGTTFHFMDASPAHALQAAREAANGRDVRIGGGATTIREFLAAGLIDHMEVVVVPIVLGRGVRLWDGLEGLEKDYQIEAVSSPSGVTHITFVRAAQ